MSRNILHLIDTGGPGGAETVYQNLVLNLDRDRWNSTITVPDDDWLASALRDRGVDPIILPSDGAFDISYLRRLQKLMRASSADLVHAHLLASSVYGTVAALVSGVPVICTFHGANDVSPTDRYATTKMRIIGRPANHVVFVSEALRQDFLEQGRVSPSQASVIHNGIDTSRYQPGDDSTLRQELGVQTGEILVGAVGNLRWWKAYDVLLRAAALVRERSARCRFVIIGQSTGDGVAENLKNLHRDLQLGDSVVFAGLRADVPKLMRNFDMYVTSSSSEGFSLTTVEAMASGLPVIATRSGGPEEIIESGRTGILIPRDSPEALAEAILSLAGDPDRFRDLGAAARRTVTERFSLEKMTQQYEALYARLLGSSDSSGRRLSMARS